MGSGASTSNIKEKAAKIEANPTFIASYNSLFNEYKKGQMENIPENILFEKMKQICLEKYPDLYAEFIVDSSTSKDIKGDNLTKSQFKIEDKSKFKHNNVYSKGLTGNTKSPADLVFNRTNKSEKCMSILKKAIGTLLFEETTENDMLTIISAMQPLLVKPHEVVITQGKTGDKFYVVEYGSLEVIVNGNKVEEIHDGGHFGELALIYDAPRAATIKAIVDCQLWSLGREEFRMIQAQTTCDSLARRSKWLRKVPLLEGLSPRQLSLLAGALKSVYFEPNEVIIKQGDPGMAFFIVESGAVVCRIEDERNSTKTKALDLVQLGPGDYFGETALLNDQPRNASIIVLPNEKVKCLRLDRKDFDSMIGPLAHLLDQNSNLRILKLFPRLNSLSSEQINQILDEFEEVEYLENKTIFSSGDTATNFYILKRGKVELSEYSNTENPKKFTLSHMNDYFGTETFDGINYTSTAVACGPTTCSKLERKSLIQDKGKITQKKLALHRTEADLARQSMLQNINFDSIVHIGVLGEGSFAKVSMVQTFINEEEILLAMKTMCKTHLIECQQEAHVKREKEVLLELNYHPFIAQLYSTHQDSKYLYMLMEFVQGGELFTLLHSDDDKAIEEHGIKFYAANVYLALEYMHKSDIAYRDLKPENILLDSTGYLKLVDMGFAKKIPYITMTNDGQEEIHVRSYTLCGTQEYLAPEFVLNIGHDIAVDYWALGILIYEMTFGYTPFETDDGDISKLFKNIAFVRTGVNKVTFPPGIENSKPFVCDFITKLLHGDPTKRLGMGISGISDIRNHAWFTSISWDDIYQKKAKAPYIPPIKGKYDLSLFEGEQGLRLGDDLLEIDTSGVFNGF